MIEAMAAHLVRRVEEIDAGVESFVHDLNTVHLTDLPAEFHRA